MVLVHISVHKQAHEYRQAYVTRWVHGGPAVWLSFVLSRNPFECEAQQRQKKEKKGRLARTRARWRQARRGCSLLAKSEIVCRTYLYHSRYYMLCQASEEDLKPRLQQLHTGTSRVHDRISRPDIPPQWRTHDEDDCSLEAVGLVVRRNSTR